MNIPRHSLCSLSPGVPPGKPILYRKNSLESPLWTAIRFWQRCQKRQPAHLLPLCLATAAIRTAERLA